MELNWFRELKASTWSSIPGWTDNILKIYEATWQTRKKNTQVFKCHFTSQWRQRLPRLSWGLSPWCGDSGTCPHHHHLPLPPVGGGPASCGRWAMSQHSLFGFTVEWQLFKMWLRSAHSTGFFFIPRLVVPLGQLKQLCPFNDTLSINGTGKEIKLLFSNRSVYLFFQVHEFTCRLLLMGSAQKCLFLFSFHLHCCPSWLLPSFWNRRSAGFSLKMGCVYTVHMCSCGLANVINFLFHFFL